MTNHDQTPETAWITGAVATDAQLSRWDLAAEERTRMLRAAAESAPLLTDLVPGADLVPAPILVPTGWNAYNPSIANTSRGLLMTVRSSNWEFKRHHYYRVNAEDGIARSRNYLVALDAGLGVHSVTLLRDETDRTGEVASASRGYGDLRLFEHRRRLRAVANTLDFSPAGTSQMVLLDIDGDRLCNRRLLSDGVSRTEKNWSPAIWNDELLLVYAFAPMRLLRWGGSRLLPAGLDSYLGSPLAIDFRGGSQLVTVGGGFLTVVHVGADYPDGSRMYLHRFVTLDAEFRLSGVSPAFVFRERGVEFAAGLAIQDASAIVSFGVSDSACWLARLPLERVVGLLTPAIGFAASRSSVARGCDTSFRSA